ncbi:MAG: SURF1 family protein [Steroidobacteraceae bacterium]
MRLRIGNRDFVPQAWAFLLTAAAVAAFVALGSWQLERGREKRAMVDSFSRGSRTSVVLTGSVRLDALPRYQHIEVTGSYDPAHQVLIDNMPSQAGFPGYRVLTPLARAGSDKVLLVDRGWVPLGASRAVLPAVAVAAGPRVVTGRLDGLPQPGVRVGQAGVPGDTHWPRVLNFPRPQDVEQALGRPVESRILLLDPTAEEGYERVWRPAMGFGPERHLGYAIQWFVFALVAVVLFVSLSLRRHGDGAGRDGDHGSSRNQT